MGGGREAGEAVAGFDGLKARAEALVPALAERAARTEALRRLPDETIAEVREAGLHRMGQPERFGGPQLPIDATAEIVTTLARGCGSTGWVCGIYADHAFCVGRFDGKAADDVWGGNPDAIIAAGFFPAGTNERVDGGWRIAGTWGFASGCDFADWFLLGSALPDATGARVPHLCLVPRSEVEIDDNWHVMGMAGTGSKNVVVKGTVVPDHRTLSVLALNEDAPDRPSPYRLPHRATVPFFFCATILGIAESLLDMVVAEMTNRSSRGLRVAELATMQMRIAEASARTDCARLLIERDTSEAMAFARAGRNLTDRERARNKRDQSWSARLCLEAADLLFGATGASGNFVDSAAQRKFRDLRAATSHVGLAWDVAAPVYGRVAFGLDPGTPMF